jgi:small subunit ribosomal protein S1
MTDEIISDSKSTSTEPEGQESLVGQSASVPIKPAEEQRLDSRSGRSEKTSDEPAPSTPDENQSPTGESDGQSSFADALSAFERSHTHRSEAKQLQGTVVSLTADQVVLDIGYKTEGVLPRSAFPDNADGVNVGDSFPVSITGRNEEGYYELSRHRVAQPRDWSALERAFAEKIAVAGTVTAVIKGGLSVDVGVRAFMPASRSGTRDAAELEALVGQQITCRISKLDVADEDVVVDRRVVLEEQARGEMAGRRAAFNPGDTITGTVRTLMPYGAFVEIEPGLDGLLHISDISRARVAKPEDVLSVGEQLTLRILKIDPETNKISLGLKQLQPEPWETAAERFVPGQRINGDVTRLTDFGAFVELEPGLEGLIHISEMSWAKKVRHPSDLLREGDRVDAVVLSVKPPAGTEQGRISLGLKQTLADPWLEVERKFPVGSQVEGPITKIMNFGAFVQIAEGVDGLVHVSEIVADRRINHPRDIVREGQRVKAVVLAIDAQKRQIKLSMKQLIPPSIDEYIAEHKVGDSVSGRVVEITASGAMVELGEGIRAALNAKTGRADSAPSAEKSSSAASAMPSPAAPDLSQLSSMLKARWKGNAPAPSAQPEPLAEGQIRTFKITKLNADSKKIEVELAAS